MKDRVRKPEWLKISIGANERYTETKRIVDSHCLHTICSSGRCPNMGECWEVISVPVAVNFVTHKQADLCHWIRMSLLMWLNP